MTGAAADRRYMHADGKLTPAKMPGEVLARFRGGCLDVPGGNNVYGVVARGDRLPATVRVGMRNKAAWHVYGLDVGHIVTYTLRGIELRDGRR